jgi:hypothetical protein
MLISCFDSFTSACSSLSPSPLSATVPRLIASLSFRSSGAYSLQGSKWTYTIAMILFGICNIVTLWCAGWTIYLALPHTAAGWKDFPEQVSRIFLLLHFTDGGIIDWSSRIVPYSSSSSPLLRRMDCTLSARSCISSPGTCLRLSSSTCSYSQAVRTPLLCSFTLSLITPHRCQHFEYVQAVLSKYAIDFPSQ